jgi:hypothetical protein
MRSDREWVEAIEVDPSSMVRLGIKVSPAEAATIDDRALTDAIADREALGMRSDEAWVRQVIASSSSVPRLGGLLVSPEEAAAIDLAIDASRDLPTVLDAYAAEHSDEWAGWYLDDGHAVVLVAGDVAAHDAAIRALLAGRGMAVTVREARWSLRELGSFRDQIWSPDVQAWFEGEGISLEGVGSPTDLNRVTMEVATARPRRGIEKEIVDHLDAADWLAVTARVDPALGPLPGELVVDVVDRAGRPVTEGLCALKPDLPNVLPAGTEIDHLDAHGRCRWEGVLSLPATGYRVEVWQAYQDGLLGFGRAVVEAGGQGRLTIQVALNP